LISHTIQKRSYSEQKQEPQYQSASDKLFADAAREEAEEAAVAKKVSRASILEQQHQNWTGDESMQDAVLRMLVDKYKPLRSGVIQSAEQKMKRAPPTVRATSVSSSSSFTVPLQPKSGSWANEPLLPSSVSHRPWHTTYKSPSHETGSIKIAQLPPPIYARAAGTKTTDERLLKKERDERKRVMEAGRLNQAKESTLDYRLGIKRRPGGRQSAMLNPTSEKGWASLVEDRIEKARAAGTFSNIKGRGQPITRTHEEYNPFIAREEFLMNRIVQRNGAAPPWVEVQGELETAIQSFREILRQSWIRRAIRILSMSHVGAPLDKIGLSEIKALRDPEWEKREESYHDTAIEEVNSLVRKYNGMAPYAVRRPYYMRTVEVESVYERCAEDIKQALIER
ncbi:hypothetical protein BDQ17DRAFT_1176579, partial [Cyathus striatus]